MAQKLPEPPEAVFVIGNQIDFRKRYRKMAKGILYVMSTVVDGLIKIGKTGTNQFETRMNQLEKMDIVM